MKEKVNNRKGKKIKKGHHKTMYKMPYLTLSRWIPRHFISLLVPEVVMIPISVGVSMSSYHDYIHDTAVSTLSLIIKTKNTFLLFSSFVLTAVVFLYVCVCVQVFNHLSPPLSHSLKYCF